MMGVFQDPEFRFPFGWDFRFPAVCQFSGGGGGILSLMMLSLGPWNHIIQVDEALSLMKLLSKAKVDYQLSQAAVCIDWHPSALSYVFGDLLQCDVSQSILQRIYLGYITPLQSSGGHLCLPSRWCSEVRTDMKTCGQKDHFVREETRRNHRNR